MRNKKIQEIKELHLDPQRWRTKENIEGARNTFPLKGDFLKNA